MYQHRYGTLVLVQGEKDQRIGITRKAQGRAGQGRKEGGTWFLTCTRHTLHLLAVFSRFCAFFGFPLLTFRFVPSLV